MNKIELKYCLELIEKEDYSEVGNSRIGGIPDLAKGTSFPEFKLPENFSSIKYDGAYYSFLLQLNLSNQSMPELPSNGLLSIFYETIENKIFGIHFPNESKLELTSTDKSNYYSWTDEYPNTSHKFKITQSISEHYKDYKDYSEEFNEEDNISHWSTDFYHSKSYFFDNSIEHKWYIYCKSQGLHLLRYSSIIRHDPISNSFVYNGLKDKTYNSLDDFLTHERIDIYKNQYTNEDEFISVLNQFDSNASIHIEKYNDFVCFLSLASNDSTEMVWGDYHKFEIFGFKSDFKEGNFTNLYTI